METLDSRRGFFAEASLVVERGRFKGGGGGGGLTACVGGGGGFFLGNDEDGGGGGGFFSIEGCGLPPAACVGGAGRDIVCVVAIVFWSPIGALVGGTIFTTLGDFFRCR